MLDATNLNSHLNVTKSSSNKRITHPKIAANHNQTKKKAQEMNQIKPSILNCCAVQVAIIFFNFFS